MQGNGEYVLTLVGQQGDKTIGPKTVGLALPYSAEYLGLDINYNLLNLLGDRTGGQVLRADAPSEAADVLFATPGQQLTPSKILAMVRVLALCLFVGIAVRRYFVRSMDSTLATPNGHRAGDAHIYHDELEAIASRAKTIAGAARRCGGTADNSTCQRRIRHRRSARNRRPMSQKSLYQPAHSLGLEGIITVIVLHGFDF
jgi:hypothetical protein